MIRKYTVSDLNRCKQLIRESLDGSVGYSTRAIEEFSKEIDDMEYFKLRSRIGEIYVFEDGEIQGMVCADGDWIRKLFVKPDYRGKGLGSNLLSHAERIIGKNGFNHTFLYSFPGSEIFCRKRDYKLIEKKNFGCETVEVVGLKMVKYL